MSKNLFLQALLTKMYGLKQKYEPNCETAENFNLWFFVILNHYFQFFFLEEILGKSLCRHPIFRFCNISYFRS